MNNNGLATLLGIGLMVGLVAVGIAISEAFPSPAMSPAMSRAERIGGQFPELTTTQCQELVDGTVWLGITEDMMRVARGHPREVNSTVGVWGRHDQWVYQPWWGDYSDSTYFYFEDGILTGWQT